MTNLQPAIATFANQRLLMLRQAALKIIGCTEKNAKRVNEAEPKKMIRFAYAHSENARICGFSSTGCYTIGIEFGGVHVLGGGFKTFDEAKNYAEKLPEKYSEFSREN